jgi:hypothetical protein
MGGKQKKKESGKKEPSIFDKPMPNPFLDIETTPKEEDRPLKTYSPEPMDNPFKKGDKSPAKKTENKHDINKLMENPFTSPEEKPQAARVPKKVDATAIQMPKRKSWEEVSATRGWTHVVKQPPKKKKA